MFKTEREMQDIFVNMLKQRKTCGLIFEEVGNRNFFFRTDVVEYKDRREIIGYELKLKDFNKLIKQSIYNLSLYDKSYMVIPKDRLESFKKIIEKYPEQEKINKIRIIIMDKEKYKTIKAPCKESTRDYKDSWKVTLIPDLIIRGYHKAGENQMKSYR